MEKLKVNNSFKLSHYCDPYHIGCTSFTILRGTTIELHYTNNNEFSHLVYKGETIYEDDLLTTVMEIKDNCF